MASMAKYKLLWHMVNYHDSLCYVYNVMCPTFIGSDKISNYPSGWDHRVNDIAKYQNINVGNFAN